MAEENETTWAATAITPYEAFGMVEMRVGRIVRAELNAKARKPAYKLWIDLGPLGEKTSSAQITELYTAEELIGRRVVCAVNFGKRLIAGFASEVLVLGAADTENRVVLLAPEREVPPGNRVY